MCLQGKFVSGSSTFLLCDFGQLTILSVISISCDIKVIKLPDVYYGGIII